MSTPLTSGKGGGSGSSPRASGGFTSLAPFANEILNLAGGVTNIAGQQVGAAQPLISGGTGQYEAGLTGQLTPAQSALVNFTNQQNDLRTASGFANMGIPGGSSTETGDLNANALQSLAFTQGLLNQDELLGLQALQVGNQFLTGGAGSLGEAGQLVGRAGGLTEQQNQDFLTSLSSAVSGLGSIAGTSSGGASGQGVSGFGSLLNNLFSKGGSGTSVDTGIGSILGGDTGLVSGAAAPGSGFIDTSSIFDLGTAAA